ATAARQDRRAQQRVALLEHPLVVAAHAGEAWLAQGEQLVEVTATLTRVTAYQSKVLRREQHHPQRPEHIPDPGQRSATQPGTVGPAGLDRQLHQQFPPVVRDRRTYHRQGRT